MANKHFSPVKRRKARCHAVQALYQWELGKETTQAILQQHLADINDKKVDDIYFKELLENIIQQQNLLDEKLSAYLDRQVAELDPIELSILRIAFYELLQRPEIPYRVVINEAVELAKIFGATDGHKFVNGVVDKAVKDLRPIEFNAKS